MRFAFRISFLLGLGLAFAVLACDDESSPRELGATAEGGAPASVTDAQAGDAQAEVTISTMRIAHLAPGLGPIDFCYQGAKKGTFVGPVLKNAAAPDLDGGYSDAEPDDAASAEDADVPPDDGGVEPVRSASYRTVSSYHELEGAGPITLAIVRAGATSCGNVLATADVTLDPGKLSTVAIFERQADGGAALEIAAFTDDRTALSNKIRVRVIHGALGKANLPGASALAVRAVAAKTTVLADRVEPRRASTASQAVVVDALGYVTAAPIPAPASIAIGPAAMSGGADAGFDPWQSDATDLDLRGGSLHTAFVLTGSAASSFEVLWCADTTTVGDQTKCQLIF